MDDREFEARNREKIAAMGADAELRAVSRDLLARSVTHEYSYHFRWLGLPIIQYPQDIVALQELVWRVQPDAIVETGVARGGSLIFYASLLHLLDRGGLVVGVDIDVRPHNAAAIAAHPLARYVQLVRGSSIDPAVVEEVRTRVAGRRVMVVLDSMHTHAHVLEELKLYAPLVGKGSYLVVLDTGIEFLPDELCRERPWSRGNSPWTAVQEFVRSTDRFVIDTSFTDKLQLTCAPDGYLECVKD